MYSVCVCMYVCCIDGAFYFSMQCKCLHWELMVNSLPYAYIMTWFGLVAGRMHETAPYIDNNRTCFVSEMLKQSRGNHTLEQVLRGAQLSGPYGSQMDHVFRSPASAIWTHMAIGTVATTSPPTSVILKDLWRSMHAIVCVCIALAGLIRTCRKSPPKAQEVSSDVRRSPQAPGTIIDN